MSAQEPVRCEGSCEYIGEEHEGEIKKVRIEGDEHELATANLPVEKHYCENAIARDREKGFTVTVIE